MNVFGNYPATESGGQWHIDPAQFALQNWPVLCRMVALDPEPPLCVVQNAASDQPCICFSPRTGQVTIYEKSLALQAEELAKRGDPFIGLLWGMMAAMARTVLIHREQIEPEKLLDAATLRASLLWPEKIVGYLEECTVDADPVQLDAYAVQSAVQAHTQGLLLDQHIDEARVARIVRAERDTVLPADFEIVLR